MLVTSYGARCDPYFPLVATLSAHIAASCRKHNVRCVSLQCQWAVFQNDVSWCSSFLLSEFRSLCYEEELFANCLFGKINSGKIPVNCSWHLYCDTEAVTRIVLFARFVFAHFRAQPFYVREGGKKCMGKLTYPSRHFNDKISAGKHNSVSWSREEYIT